MSRHPAANSHPAPLRVRDGWSASRASGCRNLSDNAAGTFKHERVAQLGVGARDPFEQANRGLVLVPVEPVREAMERCHR